MIRFFSKMRFKLATENRMAKYLRYAIGEIMLVVIGILIALQINNWNLERIEKQQETTILANLNKEFSDNLNSLIFRDSLTRITIENLGIIFSTYFSDNFVQPQGAEIDSILSIALNSSTWEPSEYVLNDLKNSGGLSKLRSDELKKLLFEWSRFYENLSDTKRQIKATNTELIAYIKEHGSLRNIDVTNSGFDYHKSKLRTDNLKLLNDYRFENYIDDKLYVLKEAQSKYQIAKLHIQKIVDATNTEINGN